MTGPCSGKVIGPYEGLSAKSLGGTSAYVSSEWGQKTEFYPPGLQKAVHFFPLKALNGAIGCWWWVVGSEVSDHNLNLS